jgi:protein tyrosine phosphatase (PTP) superfamily phosphohydrolase (DUF442 family)
VSARSDSPETFRLPPIGGKRMLMRYWLRDHAALRVVLPNCHRVDDDLYRSGHPHTWRLARLRAGGLQSVLSLRGDPECLPNMIERDACSRLGLMLRFVELRTTSLPRRETLLDLVAQLREMPKPMLVHCKSGADRTGLAVTLYRHVLRGEPLAKARRALNWRYGHLGLGAAGVVHRLLDAYGTEAAATGIGFEEWVATHYDRARLQDAGPA